MSAFIVSRKHINTLVSWAVADGVAFTFKGTVHRFTEATAQDMAALLHSENVRSVNYRYNERTRRAGFIYATQEVGELTSAEVLMHCECLDYQSCETTNYTSTKAWYALNAIKVKAANIMASEALKGRHVWSL